MTNLCKLCQYIVEGGGNYCLHGIWEEGSGGGRLRQAAVGRGAGWGTDSWGLLSRISSVCFFKPSLVSKLFYSSLHPGSRAVHSSSRDSVLMSLGTPPVLDRARMVWLTAAISTAREMGSWCSLCAALSSWHREDTKHSGGSQWVRRKSASSRSDQYYTCVFIYCFVFAILFEVS